MNNEEQAVEKNIIDVIEDFKKVWPFCLIFPEEEKKDDGKRSRKKDDVVEDVQEPEKIIVGFNIDQGVDQGLGLIHFVLKYDVQFETLKVVILQARNLVGKDPRGTSDPYAEITFVPRFRDDKVFKTEIKMKTLNPIWNHVFVFLNFTSEDLVRYKVRITLYDWDKYSEHEALGEVFYDLKKLNGKGNEGEDKKSALEDKSSVRDWVASASAHFGVDEYAEAQAAPITEDDEKIVQRSASMIINPNLDEYEYYEEEEEENAALMEDGKNEEIGHDEPDDTPKVHIVRRIEIKRNLQALPNSRSSYGELLISLNYVIRTRCLNVTIVKARNMIDPTTRALVPYCIIRHLFLSNDREKTKGTHHTSYRFYTINPVWNEEFPLKVAPNKLKQTAVEIQVFHSTSESKFSDEELGTIRLGLKTYPAQKAHYVEFLSNIGKPVAHWHLIRS